MIFAKVSRVAGHAVAYEMQLLSRIIPIHLPDASFTAVFDLQRQRRAFR